MEMASADGHVSLIPTAKRSACDRCRKHKVACPPRNKMESDCARCVRAGAACVTGYIKPLGKSALRPPSMTSSDAMSTTTTLSPGQDFQSSHSRDFCEPTELAELMEAWQLPGLIKDGGLIGESWEHWAALPVHSEGLQAWAGDTTGAQSLEMLPSSDHAEQNMLNMQSRQPVSPPSSPTQLSSSPGQSPSSTCDVRKDLDAAEYNLRLSQLRVNLARQMMHRASSSPDRQPSMMDEAGNAAEFQRIPFPSHTLGEALCSTSEFLDLVRSHRRLGGSTWPGDDPTGLVDLVLSYLHLVAVFNCLFQKLYHALSGGGSLLQSGAMQGLHPLPNLHLSGFAVSEGKLQTRILLQATQHQFKQVERDLGIPPEFAVSLRTRDPDTSTHGDHVRALFQVIFREDQNTHHLQ